MFDWNKKYPEQQCHKKQLNKSVNSKCFAAEICLTYHTSVSLSNKKSHMLNLLAT